MNYLNNLTPNQKNIVLNNEGIIRIFAGPGAGKTRVMTSKIAYLLDNNLAYESEILVITFTNKASNEIKDRIHKYTERDMQVFTYHSWSSMLLRRYGELFNVKQNFKIIDGKESINLVKDIKDEVNSDLDADEVYYKLSSYRNQTTTHITELEKEILKKYIAKKEELNLLDFDDLLEKVNDGLKNNPQAKDLIRNKYKYIFVDEFQDTNQIQYDILKSIVKNNLVVVGDPNQNIYSWRGSDLSIMLNLDKDFSNTKTFVLNENFRNSKSILKAALSLIKQNTTQTAFDLVAKSNKDEDIRVYEAKSQYSEALYVVNEIIRLNRVERIPLHEMAIIFRNNSLSRDFETALLNNDIKYKLIGGFKFFERKEVKEVLNFLYFSIFKDNYSLSQIINVPARGIGKKTIEKLTLEANARGISLWENLKLNYSNDKKLSTFIKETNGLINNKNLDSNLSNELIKYFENIGLFDSYSDEEDRGENIYSVIDQIKQTFKTLVGTFEEKAVTFFNSVALFSSTDVVGNEDHVNMLTCHASKGTEYKVVFFVCFNDNILPSWKSLQYRKGLEEERRVAFVAITRAIEKLYLTYSTGIDLYGRRLEKSMFIDELEEGGNNYNYSVVEKHEQRPTSTASKLILNNGDVVIHKIFGEGVVIEVDVENITVAFNKKIGIKQIINSTNFINKK